MRLRIIAGYLGGRFIESPDTPATHPMSERVRGALFNRIEVQDKTLLDAFAGSGAVGFEAISRGARAATLIDRNRKAQTIIVENRKALDLTSQEVRLVKANCRAWATTYSGPAFDIIICDPPYSDVKTSTFDLLQTHLKHNGLMVVSYSGRESAPAVNGVVVVDTRYYGDAALAIYRR